MPILPTYILITAARNEARFIELTLQSMIAQTVLPLKWIIVNDGSTDGTEEIVKRYLPAHPWIELVQLPGRTERHFAGKVYAFNAGYARTTGLSYDIIGNLDADVSFDSEYFEFLLHQFALHPRLGVAGTAFVEQGRGYDYRFTNIEHVSGQCQLFRRECFQDIGGYYPRKIGGIDWVAVTTARMKGWPTRTFEEKAFVHHRLMSTATHNRFAVPFCGGLKDYALGSHPVWEVFRCAYQTVRPPVLVGGPLRLAGFLWALLSQRPIEVPADLVRFRREEELRRLRAALTLSSRRKHHSSPEPQGRSTP